MITPIEFKMVCDNGAKCLGAYTRQRVKHPAGAILLAHTKTAAHRQAEGQGWRRVKLGTCGPMADLCPECAAKRAES